MLFSSLFFSSFGYSIFPMSRSSLDYLGCVRFLFMCSAHIFTLQPWWMAFFQLKNLICFRHLICDSIVKVYLVRNFCLILIHFLEHKPFYGISSLIYASIEQWMHVFKARSVYQIVVNIIIIIITAVLVLHKFYASWLLCFVCSHIKLMIVHDLFSFVRMFFFFVHLNIMIMVIILNTIYIHIQWVQSLHCRVDLASNWGNLRKNRVFFSIEKFIRDSTNRLVHGVKIFCSSKSVAHHSTDPSLEFRLITTHHLSLPSLQCTSLTYD